MRTGELFDPISDLLIANQISPKLGDEFRKTIVGVCENYRVASAMERLPKKPVRDISLREGIFEYLKSDEGMGPWLSARVLTRALIRKKAPKAYLALANWLRDKEPPEGFEMLAKRAQRKAGAHPQVSGAAVAIPAGAGSASVEFATAATVPVPAVAPQLYKERAKPRSYSAEQFLRDVYGPWLEGRGLYRHMLRKLDPALVNALQVAFVRQSEKLARLLPTKSVESDQRLKAAFGHVPTGEARRHALTVLAHGGSPVMR